MEIYTQNLLGISVQENRLQSNFIFIDSAIKNINQQLIQLLINHDSMSKTLHKNHQSIDAINNALKTQSDTISHHSQWIQQFSSEIAEEQSPSQQQLLLEQLDLKPQEINKREHNSRDGSSRKDSRNSKLEIVKSNEDKLEILQKKEPAVETKPGGKNVFEKVLSGLKQRLSRLQQESETNKPTIEEINKMITKHKTRQAEHHQHRQTKDISKRFSSNKHMPQEQHKLASQNHQQQPKGTSQKSMSRLNTQIYDIFAGQNILQGLDNEKMQIINKEISSLKDALCDKIRVIDAQYKENQHRMQAVQKSVDIIQRSHQMLKYDFDRTSSSFSRQRTNDTQERGRRDHKSNQNSNSNKEYYEQKMVGMFNQMDKLKKQYMQFHNKLQMCQQTGEIPQNLINGTDSKLKLSNYKLIHTLKNEGGENKKQLTMMKRDLLKLRQQFQEFAWGVNTSSGDVKTVVIKPNQTKQDWKVLSTKIYKLKMELQSGVRDLQSKIVTNNDMVVVLNQLEVGIEECKLLLKRKVQQSDYEKGLKRLEGRLNNFIMQVYDRQGKQQQAEASLAKQPWFCLSCDSQLKNFTGKLIKSPTNEKLIGRKVNPESHMVRRCDNSRLPSVIK